LHDVIRIESRGKPPAAARLREGPQTRCVTLVDDRGGVVVPGLKAADEFVVGKERKIQRRPQECLRHAGGGAPTSVQFRAARGPITSTNELRAQFETVREVRRRPAYLRANGHALAGRGSGARTMWMRSPGMPPPRPAYLRANGHA